MKMITDSLFHLPKPEPYQRPSAGTAGAGVSVETGWRVKATERMADRAAPAVGQPRLVLPAVNESAVCTANSME